MCCLSGETGFNYTVSQKKVITFKISVTLSNLNRFLKFLDRWKAHEISYKTCTTLPTLPLAEDLKVGTFLRHRVVHGKQWYCLSCC